MPLFCHFFSGVRSLLQQGAKVTLLHCKREAYCDFEIWPQVFWQSFLWGKLPWTICRAGFQLSKTLGLVCVVCVFGLKGTWELVHLRHQYFTHTNMQGKLEKSIFCACFWVKATAPMWGSTFVSLRETGRLFGLLDGFNILGKLSLPSLFLGGRTHSTAVKRTAFEG